MNDLTIEYDDDIFFYYGDIHRAGYSKISDILEAKQTKQESACLILVTHGGDPDAAYRIARAINHHYKGIEILIPDICKSAGTLVCIGSHRIIFGDRGELGPLDIQLEKPDEMFENMSGLDITESLVALEGELLSAFRQYLVDIRGGSRIKTQMAAEIATNLAEGLIAPIAARIDPVTLGAHQRALRIAHDYGSRLNELTSSLRSDALLTLISGYPSHSFVIDRKEAGTIFKNVSAPEGATHQLYCLARQWIENMPYPEFPNAPAVFDVKEVMNQATIDSESDQLDKEEDHEERGTDDRGIKEVGKDVASAPDGEGLRDGAIDIKKKAVRKKKARKTNSENSTAA